MDSNDIAEIIAIVLIVGGVIAVAYSNQKKAKEAIRTILRARGATNVDISSAWSAYDRASLTYDVAYTDADGYRRQTRCKVDPWRLSPGTNKGLYWQDPPQ